MKLDAQGNSSLISSSYRAEQERLHQGGNYGTASIAYAPLVSQIIEKLEVSHLLDYGCGANVNLAKEIKLKSRITYQAYDPAVPRFSKEPLPAQMVACIDVLEHIEPDLLDNVLDDLRRLTEGVLFASVHTGPAVKVLSDGRNAHLTQEPPSWWLPKFLSRFDLQSFQMTHEHGFYVVGYAKSTIEATDGSVL